MIYAKGTNFSGAGRHGIAVNQNCTIHAGGANLSNCGSRGLSLARNCTADASGVNVSGSNQGIYLADCSTVHANGSNMQNCTNQALYAVSNCNAHVGTSNMSGSNEGIYATGKCSIHAPSCTMSNMTGRAIRSEYTSEVNAYGSSITSTFGGSCILASIDSNIGVRTATLTNSTTGSYGAYAQYGSHIDATNTNLNTVNFEYVVIHGSTVARNGATGGTAINVGALNTITSAGIIYG
jgi:hypothetical protein